MTLFIRLTRPAAAAIGAALLAGAGLAGCAEDIGPTAYNPYAAGSVARVDEGVVVAADPIRFRGDNPGTGAVVGGVTGGMVGAQFGGGAAAHAGLGIAGAVVGAIAGNAVQKGAERTGFVYTVRLADRGGRLVQVPQADPYAIPQGTRVYISYGPDRARLRPIAGYAPPPAPAG